MSSNEENYSSEEDEDYVPGDNPASDDEDEYDEKKSLDCNSDVQDNCVADNLDKDKVDQLWNTFKSDVQKVNNSAPKSDGITTPVVAKSEKANTSPIADDVEAKLKSMPENVTKETSKVEPKQNEISSEIKEKDTVTITKIYDFAGEEVKVTKEVKRDSKEAQNHLKQQSATTSSRSLLGRTSIVGGLKKRPGGGIGSVLGKLGKKPKLSTLEKSKLDWNQYKEEEGIEEELQNYNKGKEGYLEKVSFLERTEMRQFQKEKEMRLNKSGGRR